MQTSPAQPVEPDARPPYARLSLYYFMYFAALGVFVPYWTVYLHTEKGFSPAEIGELTAIFMLSKVLAPFLWGWVSDATGRRLGVIRSASLFAMLCFAGTYLRDDFLWMALVMGSFGFFWNASLPQFEVLTLNHLGTQSSRYSRIRLWGSIGYIVSVLLVPQGLEQFGAGRILEIMLLLFAGIWLSTWLVTDKPQVVHTTRRGHLWDVLRQPAVWVLLLGCFLMQASHGPYYTFFSIYLDTHGYSRQLTGVMWAVGVAAEVVLFVFMYRLIQRFGASRLFVLTLFLAALRWVLLAYGVDHFGVLVLAQLLHAATFGIFHATAIHLVHHAFPSALQGRGQALYAAVGGGGAATGSLLSGYGWEALGAQPTLLAAAACVLLAGVVAQHFVRESSDA